MGVSVSSKKDMVRKKDIVRPGIVIGEILTLQDFCFRAKISRYGWSALLRRAVKADREICFREGRQVYVDTQEWVDFMKESRRGGTRRTGSRTLRGGRSAAGSVAEGSELGSDGLPMAAG